MTYSLGLLDQIHHVQVVGLAYQECLWIIHVFHRRKNGDNLASLKPTWHNETLNNDITVRSYSHLTYMLQSYDCAQKWTQTMESSTALWDKLVFCLDRTVETTAAPHQYSNPMAFTQCRLVWRLVCSTYNKPWSRFRINLPAQPFHTTYWPVTDWVSTADSAQMTGCWLTRTTEHEIIIPY